MTVKPDGLQSCSECLKSFLQTTRVFCVRMSGPEKAKDGATVSATAEAPEYGGKVSDYKCWGRNAEGSTDMRELIESHERREPS